MRVPRLSHPLIRLGFSMKSTSYWGTPSSGNPRLGLGVNWPGSPTHTVDQSCRLGSLDALHGTQRKFNLRVGHCFFGEHVWCVSFMRGILWTL